MKEHRNSLRFISRLMLAWCVWASNFIALPTADAERPRGRARIFQWQRQGSEPRRVSRPATKATAKPAPVAQTQSLPGDGASFSAQGMGVSPAGIPTQNMSAAEDNQVFTYDGSTGKWGPENATGEGGGATDLPQLDDVSNDVTSSAAVGDFLGWDGTDWDDIAVTLDTLTDVAITTPATKQTIRYNGSGWVNSQLASTDLSDFAATIAGGTGDVLGWNGSAWDDITINADFLSDVTITSFAEGETLRWNGSALVDSKLATTDLSDFDAAAASDGEVPVWNAAQSKYIPAAIVAGEIDADGVADGWVLTARDDASSFEAPQVGGLLTPDGGTTITKAREFNVKDYGASGSRRIYYGTSTAGTYTTKDSGGTPVDHQFAVGNGVFLLESGAVADVVAPSVTGTYASITQPAITFTANATSNLLTTSVADAMGDGDAIRFTTSAADLPAATPSGLSTGTTYYVAKQSSTTYRVYDSEANALADDGATGFFDITDAGTGTHSLLGVTTYEYTFVAYDKDGAHSTASSTLQTTSGYETLSANNANEIRFHIPRNSVSVAIYGRGTSSRKLLTHYDCTDRWRNDGEIATRATFSAIANNGGAVRMTVASGHGIQVGDYVQILTLSGDVNDEVYDVEAEVTGLNGSETTLDFSGLAHDGMAGTSSGYVQLAQGYWDDKGDAVAFDAARYIPDQENPPMVWRAGMAVWQGQLVCDRTGGRMYRAVSVRGTRRTGTVEPTWSSEASTTFIDNEVIWMRSLQFAEVAEPSAATRKGHWTTIATVPTSSTFTIADAAGAEIGSNKLLIAHNDALAFRECFAAALAHGTSSTQRRGATIKIPGEYFQLYLPGILNTTYWTHSRTGSTTRQTAFWSLLSGTQNVPFPNISIVADPSATIAVRQCQNGGIIEDLGGSYSVEGSVGFLKLGLDEVTIQGGVWEWAPFSGGFSEVAEGDNAFSSRTYWVIDSSSGGSLNLSTVPQGVTIRDVEVHWPSIWEVVGQTDAATNSYRNMRWYNSRLFYGGGDGDFPAYVRGGFVCDHSHIENDKRSGSHGLYLGSGQNDFKITNNVFRYCGLGGGNKFAIQVRGEGGDGWASNILIDNNTFINCDSILLGDATSSNRNHKIVLSNCMGTGVGVSVAECRNVSIYGGTYGHIDIREDCRNVRIENLDCLRLTCDASDTHRGVKIRGIDFSELLSVDNCTDVLVEGCHTFNPHTKSTSLVSGVYEWVATGSNDEYYCRLRATGGDPGISSPTGVQVRDVVSLTAGTLGSLGSDAWYYGDPGALGYSTVVVKLGDSLAYNPDENPSGTVRLITLATDLGLRVEGTVTNATFRDISLRSDWVNYTAMLSGSAPTLRGVKFLNILTEYAGTPVNDNNTLYCWDFSSTNLPLAEEIVIENCEWLYNRTNTGALRRDIRMPLGRGGNVTLRNCKMKMWSSNSDFGTCFGSVHMEGCEIQTNEMLVTPSVAANTLTPIEGYRTNLNAAGVAMVIEQGPASAFPTATSTGTPATLTAGQVIWLGSGSVFYPTDADRLATTNAYDITAVGSPTATVLVRQLAAANSSLASTYEFLGYAGQPDVLGHVKDNLIRGSKAWTYAQITSNQSDYQLVTVINTHRLSSDASREIDGFNAPGGGTVHGRRDRIINVGAQDIVLKDDTDTGSVAQNRIACHTNADITISAGESIEIEYDAIAQVWRTISYTASWELKSDIMPLRRLALWAIEPKRIQLALAA